ncbi:ImmA/IrrE family metallo-endopeptidase [Bacillus sp. JHAA]|uniref:ImmA/IrrE family metallo-endopeptidase n=1 Tax=Bacillus TaxID=1386 RepID=UPI0002E3E890|nr:MULTISPECIES: ImmA/IrrE family metallo-endopeptidase [Bacillus]MBW8281911.1 ImmA/IrrE family metallo-endopeptidase [Bacillus amyloliquefaciens]MCP1460301.1 Zn-dependent peptidase ImmA (M78 family) [Bacillus amyloliquefaciens]MCU9590320.1 ImmA/IrrE family metallo-endopeptidase [Bacillus velezensis]MDU0077702.1 ImmA/IrrE family metallo-endopeptidase [Bacillus sp. IG2]MDU0103049.1 ImmA/IrrE family metallo-endopeptidase [Bacillus sp. IS1]
MVYTKSHLEDWIERLYREINILHPSDINFDHIAHALDILIVYNPVTSFALRFKGMFTISLDSRKSRKEQWLDFSHEVCHEFRHENNDKIMPIYWKEYLECQANYFAYHFCIPTFMLRQIEIPHNQYFAAQVIADIFKVPESFAYLRLNMYLNKARLII